jgi:hypothetical protein
LVAGCAGVEDRSRHPARFPTSILPFLSFRAGRVLKLRLGHSEIILIFGVSCALGTFPSCWLEGAALERAKLHAAPAIHLDPALIDRFGRMMPESFSSGSVPVRKARLPLARRSAVPRRRARRAAAGSTENAATPFATSERPPHRRARVN